LLFKKNTNTTSVKAKTMLYMVYNVGYGHNRRGIAGQN